AQLAVEPAMKLLAKPRIEFVIFSIHESLSTECSRPTTRADDGRLFRNQRQQPPGKPVAWQ
ncbi:MAG: hypothetical protein ACREJM_01280, partial [Candidatus Saccharimonadales bacterium]